MPKYDKNQGLPKKLFDLLGGENAKRGEYAKLARAIGTSTAAVSNYVNGFTGVSTDKLAEIAKYFDVSADYLLGLEGSDMKKQLEKAEMRGYRKGIKLASEALYDMHIRFEQIHRGGKT